MRLANQYASLPARFFATMVAQPVREPRLLRLNVNLARQLGLDVEWLETEAGAAFLAGAAFPEGMQPVATAYAGHQFGQFVPQLGDGRALLLGDGIDREGQPYEIQLKGSGPTPYSRRGDGRAALGPVLREYLVSEAMAALGVPTTRALAAVSTGESVLRERMKPGAVLARVASSHLRVGTFQFFAAREDRDGLRILADFAIQRHYPKLVDRDDRYLAFFDAVVSAQARLIAQWMSLGFVHGVMNTDNMAISGETIDYGPCAFLDEYDRRKVFSSIDQTGRYAFSNQPDIGFWNLTRLAECLLPLIDPDSDRAVAVIKPVLLAFPSRFSAAFEARMQAKFGLLTKRENDLSLVSEFLDRLEKARADYTLSFRQLSVAPTALDAIEGLAAWRMRWEARLAEEEGGLDAALDRMRRVNPAVIPRNHRIEAVIAAAEKGDMAPFEAMFAAVTQPFCDDVDYETPPTQAERVRETFCGT